MFQVLLAFYAVRPVVVAHGCQLLLHGSHVQYQGCLDMFLGALAPSVIEQVLLHVVYVFRQFRQCGFGF
jgi:hypothetical protein